MSRECLGRPYNESARKTTKAHEVQREPTEAHENAKKNPHGSAMKVPWRHGSAMEGSEMEAHETLRCVMQYHDRLSVSGISQAEPRRVLTAVVIRLVRKHVISCSSHSRLFVECRCRNISSSLPSVPNRTCFLNAVYRECYRVAERPSPVIRTRRQCRIRHQTRNLVPV